MGFFFRGFRERRVNEEPPVRKAIEANAGIWVQPDLKASKARRANLEEMELPVFLGSLDHPVLQVRLKVLHTT